MKRNKFSLSNYKLLTCNMGQLVPIQWYEVIPGDTFQVSTSMLIRCSPLLAPLMHPVKVRIHHWYVPNRLIWDDWEEWIVAEPSPTWPHIDQTTITESSLYDHLGVFPAAYGETRNFSALPIRAYDLIWNEHYRDQDIDTELTIDTTDGADTTSDDDVQSVSWEKDYFTTARPWAQKGDEVTIPVQSGTPDYVDIEDLRLGQALYRYQEARAQYGSRYIEYLRYLGVKSSDGRLQNPEYLGGGRQILQFSEIIQTAEGTDPVGTMRGHGIAAMRTRRFRRFFEEHGIVMTLMSVVPKQILVQSHDRGWTRNTKEDYFTRELQDIGEQAVTYLEVNATQVDQTATFGYQRRYDEYKQKFSGVSGEFNSTRNHWHLGRFFAGDVALNSSFLACTPSTRVFADEESDQLIIMSNNSVQARRPIKR